MSDISSNQAVQLLRQLPTIRERSNQLYQRALEKKSQHFSLDLSKLEQCCDFVLSFARKSNPTLKVPFHSRWRHFQVGNIDRVSNIKSHPLFPIDAKEQGRLWYELTLISVLLDAGAGSSVGLADGDGVIVFDASDSDNGKKVLMSDIKSYAAGAALVVAQKADTNALEEDKINYFADLSADATVTLPASAAGLVGKSIYIKAKDLTSGATIIVNTQATDQKIDGANSIILESPYASVRLVYVATDDWRVF